MASITHAGRVPSNDRSAGTRMLRFPDKRSPSLDASIAAQQSPALMERGVWEAPYLVAGLPALIAVDSRGVARKHVKLRPGIDPVRAADALWELLERIDPPVRLRLMREDPACPQAAAADDRVPLGRGVYESAGLIPDAVSVFAVTSGGELLGGEIRSIGGKADRSRAVAELNRRLREMDPQRETTLSLVR